MEDGGGKKEEGGRLNILSNRFPYREQLALYPFPALIYPSKK